MLKGTLRLSFFATVALLIAVLPAAAGVVITIDKSIQRMTVAVDGTTRWRWPVSTGARGYDTPNGSGRPGDLENTGDLGIGDQRNCHW